MPAYSALALPTCLVTSVPTALSLTVRILRPFYPPLATTTSGQRRTITDSTSLRTLSDYQHGGNVRLARLVFLQDRMSSIYELVARLTLSSWPNAVFAAMIFGTEFRVQAKSQYGQAVCVAFVVHLLVLPQFLEDVDLQVGRF